MAVFVSGSDETSGRDQRDSFFFGGWVGPEEDWSRFFAPAWQERVLDGPPSIPYLHMTEMRSSQWRTKYGLTKLKANDRIDEAVRLLDQMATFFPIGVNLDGGHFRDKTKAMKVIPSAGGAATFEPDYVCFLTYVFYVLSYVSKRHPEAIKVDFIVERNGCITKHIQEFHAHLALHLRGLGRDDLAILVGELIPAGKDRIPLQAADLLCWHTARARHPETMDADDFRRYAILAHRLGNKFNYPNDQVSKMMTRLSKLPAVAERRYGQR